MSRGKRKKQYAAQQKAAEAILMNRDLEKNPLTAAEIVALPRSQRPPRSEWPDAGVGENPKLYPKRRKPMKREWFPSSGGFDADAWSIIVFLTIWAVCSLVFCGVYTSLGMESPFSVIVAIISGLFAAIMIRGGGAGFDPTRWW